MKNTEQTRTGQVLKVMQILAWVAAIGFLIETGAILVSYVVSWINPEAARNLYKGLDLYDLSQYSFAQYTLSVIFLMALPVLKSILAFQVIKTLSKFNLQQPFTPEVADRLQNMSYLAMGAWVVTMLNNVHLGWLLKSTGKLYGTWLSGEFIFMVGLVFVFAQVFKRGVEIQSENDLTV